MLCKQLQQVPAGRSRQRAQVRRPCASTMCGGWCGLPITKPGRLSSVVSQGTVHTGRLEARPLAELARWWAPVCWPPGSVCHAIRTDLVPSGRLRATDWAISRSAPPHRGAERDCGRTRATGQQGNKATGRQGREKKYLLSTLSVALRAREHCRPRCVPHAPSIATDTPFSAHRCANWHGRCRVLEPFFYRPFFSLPL